MTSINTNAAALTALRTLQATSTSLESTQNRISTGLKIGSAKDNAAYWSITTALKSDNKSLGTVKDALGLGAATVDVAYQGLTKAKDVLDEIKAKLTSATQAGVDRAAVQADLSALQDQLRSIASSSNFSGENWLQVNSGTSTYDPNKTVVASFARDANNAISIGTIQIDTSKTALFDSNAGSNAGIINSQTALSADGEDLGFGGTVATGTVPLLQGFDTAQSFTSQLSGAAEAASISLGDFSAAGVQAGDRLTFDLSVDNIKTAVTVKLTGLNIASTAADFKTLVDAGISDAFGGAAVATSSYDAAAKQFKITSATPGAISEVSISNIRVLDGDSIAPNNAGAVTDLGIVPGTTFGTGTKMSTNFTFDATNSEAGDKLQFRFTYKGDVYDTSTVTLAAADIADAAGYATLLQTMVNGAKRVSDNAALGSGKLLITQDATTATQVNIDSVGRGLTQTFGVVAANYTDKASPGVTAAFDGAGLVAGAIVAGTATVATKAFTYVIANAGVGNSLNFDMTYFKPNADDSASVAVRKNITVAAAATAAQMALNLQSALDTAFGVGALEVNTTGGITIKTTVQSANTGYVLANVKALDGDGVLSAPLISTAGASDQGRGLLTSDVAASAVLGSTFGGPVTFGATDSIRFDVTVDGVSSKARIDKATVDAALGSNDGVITTADDFALVVSKALSNAGVGGVKVTNESGSIRVEKTVYGSGSVAITNGVSSAGGSTIAVTNIDLTASAFTSLTDKQKASALTAYISVVNAALTKVISAAASLGSVSSRIDMQSSFVTTLMDTIDKGVGNLIDADVSEESTKLQALQVKQQLGVQALSIANQSSQQILRLFQ